MGVYSASSDVNASDYMAQVQRIHMPDMEQMEAMYILPDQMYGDMILMTRVAARDCDIYVLPGEQFQTWAAKSSLLVPPLVA